MRGLLGVLAMGLVACGQPNVSFYEPRVIELDAGAGTCAVDAQCAAGEVCSVYESPTASQSRCAPRADVCAPVTCPEEATRCLVVPDSDGHVACLKVLVSLHDT